MGSTTLKATDPKAAKLEKIRLQNEKQTDEARARRRGTAPGGKARKAYPKSEVTD